MDAQKVDMFIVANARYFKPTMITSIREKLLSLDDSKWGAIQSVGYKDPTTALIVSILLGGLGIDRFYIGNNVINFVDGIRNISTTCSTKQHVRISCNIHYVFKRCM